MSETATPDRRLTLDDPLPKRLKAWADERFQIPNALLFLALFGTACLYGRAVAHEGALWLSWLDVGGFFAVWAFFLLLRVYDEHKDYALDLHNHPERVLQSGLITLGHLKVLGVLSVLLQAGVSLGYDSFSPARTTAFFGLVTVWGALMAKEFFIGEWLEKRLVPYALSHMIIMPMALMWMAQMGAGGASPMPVAVWPLAVLSFMSGAAFEITRKTRGPEEERETVDSYTKVWGTGGAPLVALGMLTVGLAAQVWLVATTLPDASISTWGVGLGVAFAIPAASLLKFRAAPSEKARERNEAAVGVSILLGYGLLIAAAVVARGFSWRG
jgi:4-hydroxybenzoate polyprenyltransferase